MMDTKIFSILFACNLGQHIPERCKKFKFSIQLAPVLCKKLGQTKIFLAVALSEADFTGP